MKPWLKTWLENRLQNWRDAEININWGFIFCVFITLTPFTFFLAWAKIDKDGLVALVAACGMSAAIIAGWCLFLKTAIFVVLCLEDLWKYGTHTEKHPSQLEDKPETELLEDPLRTQNRLLEAALDQSAREVRQLKAALDHSAREVHELVIEIHRLETVQDVAREVVRAWLKGSPSDMFMAQLAAMVRD